MDTRSAWILDSTAPEGVRECWIVQADPSTTNGGLSPLKDGELWSQWFTLAYYDWPSIKTVHRCNTGWLQIVNQCYNRVIKSAEVFFSKEDALKCRLQLDATISTLETKGVQSHV